MRAGDVAEEPARAIVKQSVVIRGHATSVSLEPEFWDALKQAAARRHLSLAALIAGIDETRRGNLSSALRVFALKEAGRRDDGV